jgi:hypothetical protein
LLTALGSSFVTSFVLAAAAADVRIESMRVRATHADSDGMGASADLELHGEVDTDAPTTHVEQLAAIALERSPVVALCKFNVRAVVTERTEARSKGG